MSETHAELAPPPAGDNIDQRSVAEIITATLPLEHSDLLARMEELKEAQKRLPDITDEASKAVVMDHCKMLAALAKKAEALRESIKFPHMRAGKAVDGFFVPIRDFAKKSAADARKPMTKYDEVKAENARIEAEQEAERQREIAAEARREVERVQREAAEAEAARQKERDHEKDLLAKAQAERDLAIKNEADLKAAIEKEREERTLARRQAVLDKQASDRERRKVREASKIVKVEAVAERKTDRAATRSDADYSRSRSSHGAVGSLAAQFTGEVRALAILDLDALRHHINPDALDVAVKSFVRAGGRELRGADIWEDSETRVY